MDSFISLQDVANIIAFVAPGYFAIKTYALVYAKGEKDFSQLLVVSAIFSLPIVSVFHFIWRYGLGAEDTSNTSAVYALSLVGFSIVIGLGFAYLRKWQPVKVLAKAIGLPGADEDFIKVQFSKLDRDEVVTLFMKNGEIFSGTPQGGNTFRQGEPRQYYFNNLAWYNAEKKRWDERPGSLIIDLSEIEHIETARALPQD
jgi:hypothetical protein